MTISNVSRDSILRVSAAFLLAGALTACSDGVDQVREAAQSTVDNASFDADLKPEAERNPAPAFELMDQNGAPVTLADYQGKVVVLNFWATWCAPCRVEMPWFNEFESQYKDQGFAVLGVSLDEEGWDVVKPFLAEHDYSYRFMIGNEQVATLYGMVESLPTTVIIDQQGRIASMHTGLVEKETYSAEIEELLQG